MYAGAATAPCRKRSPKDAGEVSPPHHRGGLTASPPCTHVIWKEPRGENYDYWEHESIVQSSIGRAAHLQEPKVEEQWSKNRMVLWETLV